MTDLDALFTTDVPGKLAWQPPSQDCDAVLQDFLQEMIELDQQPAAESPKKVKIPVDEDPRPTKKPKTDTQRWQRRKQSLQKLQSEVDSLQSQVQALLLQKKVVEPSQWAEQKNQQLKGQVDACVQISGALKTVLNAAGRLRTQQLERDSIASRALRIEMMLQRQTDEVDPLVFDMLEASVNARVGELQLIANEMRQPLTLVSSEDIQICRSNETHPVVEFRTARMLPFDVDTVGRVCWGVSNLGCIASRPGGRVVRRSADAVASDVCLPVVLGKGQCVEIRTRCVVKRFQVQGSFVVLAESLTEWPAHLVDSGAWTRTTRESGWGLTHPYPVTRGNSASRSSASRFMMHLSTAPSTTDIDDSHRLLKSAAVSDIVIPSFQQLIRHRQQNVDNHLMDAACAARSLTA